MSITQKLLSSHKFTSSGNPVYHKCSFIISLLQNLAEVTKWKPLVSCSRGFTIGLRL